jgi:hypothetical protein
VLSLAVLAGLVVAYPVNVWLVKSELKHGMGTVRVLGHSGRRAAPAPPADHTVMDMSGPSVTRAQMNAVAALTIVVLAAGVVLAAALGDFSR